MSPRKRPVQSRSRETVDAIVEACAQVLGAKGYAGATLDRIAERAGVSVGSIYQYFPSKEALLAATMERHIGQMESRLTSAAALNGDATVEQFVRAVVTASVEAHLEDPALHLLFVTERPRVGHLDRYELSLARFSEALASWIHDRQDLRVADPDVRARLIVVSLDACIHDRALGADAIDIATLVNELTTMVCAHLRAP